MQYCEQDSLINYMKENTILHFTEQEALDIIKQIISAYKQFLKHKILHKYIHPDILLLTKGRVVIGEIGDCPTLHVKPFVPTISKQIDAPEVLSEKPHTEASDLWSLGVTFYKLLFDKWPFQSNYQSEILIKQQKKSGDNLVMIRKINDVSKETEDLLKKMLVFEQDKRMTWNELINHPLITEKEQGSVQPQESENDKKNTTGGIINFLCPCTDVIKPEPIAQHDTPGYFFIYK